MPIQPSPSYIRLRQICLVTRDIDRAQMQLTEIFGLSVAFRDERIVRYGLQNFLVPVGTSFLEVVAPIQPDTAAGRFLDRFHERHGYMAIFDCGELDEVRTRVEQLGIRILHSRKWPRYENIQLHPRDTGAALLEFHHNLGGDDLNGYYEPAGKDWHRHVRDNVSVSILGVEFRAPDPANLAARWSKLFDRPATSNGEGRLEIKLDSGVLRFLPGSAEEHLHAVLISVRIIDPVLDVASRLGCAVEENAIDICGVWFRLCAHRDTTTPG